jgi:hypothetical protein
VTLGSSLPQQFQLQIAQRFTLGTEYEDGLLAQALFQHLDLELCSLQFTFEMCNAQLRV